MNSNTYNTLFSKKFLNIEIIIFVIFIAGLFAKTTLNLQVNLLIITSLLTLSILYTVISVSISNNKNIDTTAKFIYMITFLGAATCFLGLLFKTMHFPGSAILRLSGLLSIIVSFFILIATPKKIKGYGIFDKMFFIRIGIVVLLTASTIFIHSIN